MLKRYKMLLIYAFCHSNVSLMNIGLKGLVECRLLSQPENLAITAHFPII